MPDDFSMDSGALIFATLADVYLSSGMVDEAISILKDGLIRNPSYTLAKIILGRAYYVKGDLQEAIKVLDNVYEEAKDSENLNLYLGHCYRKTGENDKAVNFYEGTLRINPENKEAKRELETLKPEEKPAEVVEEVPKEKIEVAEGKKETEPVSAAVVQEKEPVLSKTEPEQRVVEPPSPFDSFNKPINELLEVETVKGAFISSKDGLLIQNYFKDRADIEEMCALTAGVYNDANETFRDLKEGVLEKCIIEKSDETIYVLNAGDALLTVIIQPEAKPGIVSIYVRKILEEVRGILG